MPVITVVDTGATYTVEQGANLMEALDRLGVTIMHACGGNCICGTCNVEIVETAYPTPATQFAEAHILSKLKRKGERVRLSCQITVNDDITVRLRPDPDIFPSRPA